MVCREARHVRSCYASRQVVLFNPNQSLGFGLNGLGILQIRFFIIIGFKSFKGIIKL